MRVTIKLISLWLWLGLFSCKSIDKQLSDIDAGQNQKTKTNYGHNIILAVDLSNRILNDRKYDDPEIVRLVTANLKTLFQQAIDVGINDKFYLTTINDKDFDKQKFSDSIFKIDLTSFKTNAVKISDYLHHNDDNSNSLKHDVDLLNSTFKQFYEDLKKPNQQNGADLWDFMKDKLSYPVIDTSSKTYAFEGANITNKYENYIILITDGYIEAGRYASNPDMRENNKFRFLSEQTVNDFRSALKRSQFKEAKDFFVQEKYGIMPVQNNYLTNSKILVIELYDRSKKNGVSTANPTDKEILTLFWRDWLINSGFRESNITLKETFNNRQDLDKTLKDFLGVK